MKRYLPLKYYGMYFRFFGNNGNIESTLHLIQSIIIVGRCSVTLLFNVAEYDAWHTVVTIHDTEDYRKYLTRIAPDLDVKDEYDLIPR